MERELDGQSNLKDTTTSSTFSVSIEEMVGISPKIQRLSALIYKVAAVDVRVLRYCTF